MTDQAALTLLMVIRRACQPVGDMRTAAVVGAIDWVIEGNHNQDLAARWLLEQLDKIDQRQP
jgi:hypothetical protein